MSYKQVFEFGLCIEDLDAVIHPIADVNVPRGVNCDAVGPVELALTVTGNTKGH